jgi:hypothetical protein
MRPRIGHRYGPGERVQAYVEVYNLTARGGASEFEVRFAIYPAVDDQTSVWELWARRAADFFGLSSGEPAVSQRFRRRGQGHTAYERMAIDIDAISPGRYELIVEVLDAATGEGAVTHTPIVKQAAPVAVRE